MNFSLFAALIDVFEENSEMYTIHQREQLNVLVDSFHSNNESTSTICSSEDYFKMMNLPLSYKQPMTTLFNRVIF